MSKSLFSVTDRPFTGGGIFTAMQSLNPPWADEDIAAQLDLIYYGNISGSKLVSPLVERLMTESKLSALETATLAGALMATNGNRWAREWATRSAEYNPIENYRMTEEMTDDETVTEYGRRDTRTDNLQHGETRTDDLAHSETRTDNLQHAETRTDNLAHSETRTDNLQHAETRTDDLAHSETRTDNLAHSETRTDNLTRTIDNQEITTPNTTTTRQQATRGFNSSADVNTDKETTTNTGTNRVDTDGTEKNTGTQGTTGSNTGTQATQGTNTGTVGVSGSNTGTQSTQGSNTGTVGTQGSDTGTVGVSGSNTGTQSTQGTDTGTQTNAVSGSDTSTRNYQLTRSGNIGVTTSQQMLESERNLWMWSFFYDVVFPDVDTVLTIPLYAEEDDSGGSGGIVPSGTINITSNGDYIVTYYAAASVQVPNTYTAGDEGKVVQNRRLIEQLTGLDIDANGEWDTTHYSSVDVQVPNTYTAGDEGKVVSGGELVAQTSRTITSNGTYDTTLNNSVIVDYAGLDTSLLPESVVSNILQSVAAGNYITPKNDIDLGAANTDCTIYGILKKYPASAAGDLFLLGALYSTTNGNYPNFFTRNNLLWVSVYGGGRDRSTGVSALDYHCIALQINNTTKTVRYYLDGEYIDSNTFTNSGQRVSFGNCDIKYFGVVLGDETDTQITDNMDNLIQTIGLD